MPDRARLFVVYFVVDEGTPCDDADDEYDIENYGPLRIEFVEASSSGEARTLIEERCGTREIRWGAISAPDPQRVQEMLARNAALGFGSRPALLTIGAL